MYKSCSFFVFFLFFALQDLKSAETSIEKPELILRKSHHFYFFLSEPAFRKREPYPWEKKEIEPLTKATKEVVHSQNGAQKTASDKKAKNVSPCAEEKKRSAIK